MTRRPDDDAAWAELQRDWNLRPGTTYLNHGSFGPPPRCVRAAQRRWQDQLDSQPMDFFVRELEPALRAARDRLAAFVGAAPANLIFVENATVGMNVVADSFPLAAGDEVLLTDHEYGAVERIWQRACQRAGAAVKTVKLPLPFRTAEETTAGIMNAATSRTRLIVVSHVTSPTAVILPVAAICREARRRGIAVAIDGPHAVAQLPLAIDALGCDYYAASCHKWLSAPFGTGFLYVAPQHQARIRPPVLSWGRLPPGTLEAWSDEFVWCGTRDPTAHLAIPAAIEFLECVGLDAFRERSHWLARYARQRLVELTGQEPLVPDDDAWYAGMAHVPLPALGPGVHAGSEDSAGLEAGTKPGRVGPGSLSDRRPTEDNVGYGGSSVATAPSTHPTTTTCPVGNPLQHTIWRELGVEVPVIDFRGRLYLRVSCHLYNDTRDIDRLADGLRRLAGTRGSGVFGG